MAKRLLDVLFLCTGNSARSIMAKAILNRAGIGRFRAWSLPAGEVDPRTVELLERLDYPAADMRSKSRDEFATARAPDLDFVFTVCDNAANEVCPAWLGQPMTAHRGVPDPTAATGSDAEVAAAFADAYRMLNNRIGIFINLPFAFLDKPTLRKRLEEIGERKPDEPA